MRKAVSPLVAAVLLIAVTMTIAAILSFWVSGFVRESLGEQSPVRECTFANFKIYSCSYSDTDNTIRVILENLGNVEVKNITAHVIYDNGTIGFHSGLANLPTSRINAYTISGVSSNYQELTIKTNCPDVTHTDDCR